MLESKVQDLLQDTKDYLPPKPYCPHREDWEKTGKKRIWEKAEQYAKKHNFEPGADILELVDKVGGTVFHLNIKQWRETKDGSILVHCPEYEGKKFHIFVSNFTGILRNRFTIAHELGHYVLHAKEGKECLKAARSGSSIPETEANNFAAAFLMPAKEFAKLYNETRHLLYVAAHFMVSEAAANVRRQQLKKAKLL